jgi:signal transduction histidine kinase
MLSGDISSDAETARVVNEVIDGLDQLTRLQLSTLIRKLHPLTLSHGLVPTFQSFSDRFGADLFLQIDLDEEFVREEMAGSNPVPEPVKLAVYRITEEALTNVVKHATAGRVTVRLDLPREGWLRLRVRDDGKGFDTESSPRGLGLATMQDYAGAVDGECEVHSAPGGGTEVTVVLPLSQPGAMLLSAPGKGIN